MSYKIIICDDNDNIRMYLRHLFSKGGEFEIVAEGRSGKQAVELCAQHSPDLILIDAHMAEKADGIRAIYDIKRLSPSTKVIVLTAYSDEELVISALKNGADNYIIKDDASDRIIEIVRDTLNGQDTISQFVANTLKKYVADNQDAEQSNASEEDYRRCADIVYKLTKSEIEILILLSRGYTRDQISRTKFVAPTTVKTHINNILKKLGYPNTQTAVAELEKIGFFNLF